MKMIQENRSLKEFNSFGIDVVARHFAQFGNIEELKKLMKDEMPRTGNNQLQTLILGGGSNILFTKNVDGFVLKNEIGGIELIAEDQEHIYVRAGAGENWHRFVLYCLENQYAGIENLALIPGSVGASPMQNIGAYGVEIADVFHSLEAFHREDGMVIEFNKADCAFGYRESVFKNRFKNQFIITSVTYKLLKKPVFNISYGAIETELEKMKVTQLSIDAIAQAVIRIRSSKLPDPRLIGNAGSFFKNPQIDAAHFEKLKIDFPEMIGYRLDNGNIKLAAGWLIEHSGPQEGTSWKGYRKADAGCHDKQALVLVNYGKASGSEIYSLSTEIVESVYRKFSVKLEREVNIY